jgi:hypothetical protein
MDTATLNDNAVTDVAEMLQRQLTLAGGAVVELEETVQSDWGALPGDLQLHILRDAARLGREVSCAVRLVSRSWKEAHASGCETAAKTARVEAEFAAEALAAKEKGPGYTVGVNNNGPLKRNKPRVTISMRDGVRKKVVMEHGGWVSVETVFPGEGGHPSTTIRIAPELKLARFGPERVRKLTPGAYTREPVVF